MARSRGFRFNLGVEAGQVMFVVVVSLALAGLHNLHNQGVLRVGRAAPYAIGGIAAYWTIDRIAAFL